MRISERLLTILGVCLLAAAIPAYASGKGERELKQAQALVEEKRYTQALTLLVEIMKEYPDLREETDKLVARIMEVRTGVNQLVVELLEAQARQDVDKGFAIITEIRKRDPYPDPAVKKLIDAAIWALQWAGESARYAEVMKAAAGLIAEKKYAEAIAVYLKGFDLSRSYFNAAEYSEIHKENARAAVAQLESVSKDAAASEAGIRAVTGVLDALLKQPVTETGREGLLAALQPLTLAREREAQIRALAVRLREINVAIDAANGEERSDPWLYSIELFALGRPDTPSEGIAFAVWRPWSETARQLSETATEAADAAYAEMERAFAEKAALTAFSDVAAEARSRGLLAIALLAVEAPAWQPAEGLTLSAEDSARATGLPVLAERMRRHVADGNDWVDFRAAEDAADVILVDLDSRFQRIPSPLPADLVQLQMTRADLKKIGESAQLGADEWEKRAAAAAAGSVKAERATTVYERFSTAAARAFKADTDLAARVAGLEASDFESRRAAAEERLERGRPLAAGTAAGQATPGKRPELAVEEYRPALADLRTLLSDLDKWQTKWTAETSHVTSSAGVSSLLAEQADLRVRVLSLQIAIEAATTQAQSAIDMATQLRGQADKAFQAGQAEEKQKKYSQALQSYITARDSYAESLKHQENAAARVRLEELPRTIDRTTIVAREQNLASVQELIDRGVRQFTETDFEGAISTLEEAREVWETAAGGQNTTIEIYLDRAIAALKVTGKQEITRTDPIYEDIRGFMTQAELSYNRAASLQRAVSPSGGFQDAITASRSSVQAITSVVPEYREARLLALKIDRLEFGTDRFAAEIRKRVDASLEDAKDPRAGEITWRDAYYSLKDYSALEGIQTILSASKRKEIETAIRDLEVKLGLRPPPVPEPLVRESASTYQDALTVYRQNVNDRIRWESALWLLQRSLDANPLNTDAQKLRNQIVVKRGTSVDVLSPDELERYRAALTDFVNRNYSRAEAIVDEQLRAKPRNPLLLDLRVQIQRAR